jgi:hypothetical protein
LVVWDTASDASRTLLTLTTERPNGEIVWSAERDRLILAVRDQVGTNGRLLVIDAQTGRSADLFRRPAPPVPVYGDSRIVVATAGRNYEVFDARDGKVITRADIASYGSIGASRDAVLFGLVRTFKAPAGPMHVWAAQRPSEFVGTISDPELDSPLFRPGRAELFFSSGHDIRAIDYRAGTTRTILRGSPDGVPVAIAFDETGQHLLLRDGRGLALYTDEDGVFEKTKEAEFALESEAIAIGLVLR